MKVYNKQHSYYCGIDLHARTMYICVLDSTGKKVYPPLVQVFCEVLLAPVDEV